ncbi:MAG: hypothetical protein ACKO04_13705 [Actinomycetes bacterium]
MDRGTRWLLSVVVASTGAAALVLQVTWQRVVAVRTGIDLVSSSVTVAAFLAGLGIGSVVGGQLADRFGRTASGRWYAAANFGIAAAALATVPALVRLVPATAPPAVELLCVLGIILVPTSLMGDSFTLLVRAVVPAARTAGTGVGRLAAVNTLGSAGGAVVGGWVLLGTFGAYGATLVAATVDVAAGLTALLLVRRNRLSADPGPATAPGPEPAPVPTTAPLPAPGPAPGTTTAPVWPWMLLYGVTGAVAIGLETVFFRVVDAAVRSNSYTFAGVLALWLVLYAGGAAAGSRFVGRVGSPRTWFLRIELGVAASTAATLALVVRVLPATPLWGPFRDWFNSDGLAGGIDLSRIPSTLLVAGLLPLFLMGLPVVLMGAALPFAQQVVTRDLGSLGRTTGRLTAANLAGNVVGGLFTSLVLFDQLGSATSAQVLVGTLLATVALGAYATRIRGDDPARRPARTAAAFGACVLLLALMPTTTQLWTFLHDGGSVQLVVEEDRACGSVAKVFGNGDVQLHINGAGQNGYPFDDFHVALGYLPTLFVEDPQRALAVGLGIGSTTYGLLANPDVRSVTTAELCGGNERIIRRLATPDRPEFVDVLEDPRQQLRTEDGRQVLREPGAPYDVIVTDTVRTTSAASGNTYSVDYYRMVRDRLAPGGVMATWVPSGRVMASVQEVFPYVVTGEVEDYGGSRFVVAGTRPLRLDPDELQRRLAASALPPDRRAALAPVVATLDDGCDPTLPPATASDLNRDLFPRDEMFLNQPAVGDVDRVRCRS